MGEGANAPSILIVQYIRRVFSDYRVEERGKKCLV